jgi:CRP/FNR family cyclic AMP-dependent transcriptional regulator
MSLLQIVKSCPLFVELHDSEIMNIVESCIVLDLDENEYIFRCGDIGHEIYLVMSGGATVQRDSIDLAKLKKGDLFGEMVLLKDRERKADIITSVPSSILVIDYTHLVKIFEQDSKVFSIIMFNLSRMLANRLYKAGGIIEELKKAG